MRFYFRILLSFLGIVLVYFIIATALIIHFTKQDFDRQLSRQLYSDARIAAELVRKHPLDEENAEELDQTMKNIGEELGARITVILPDGWVYADSFYDPEEMENHISRVEVQQALSQGVGEDSRISPTLGISMSYLALPVEKDSELYAIIRAALPQSRIREQVYETIYKSVLLGALIAGIFAGIISIFVARSYSRPVQLIKNAAVNISGGDFSYRLQLRREDELFEVAEALNRMSEKLGRYFDSITESRERLAAILRGMNEELLLVTSDEMIYLANDAFCRLFNEEKNEIVGRKYWEVIRMGAVSSFIKQAFETRESSYSEILIRAENAPPRNYQMSASPVFSATGEFRGVVILFHNITPIREMDKMRRQFVDNASHELKTPISAVIAVSETLLDNDPDDPQIRKDFYQKIYNNTQRLNSLITDMLSLSEIEQRKSMLERTPDNPGKVVSKIVEDLAPAFRARKHIVNLEIDDDIPDIELDRKTITWALDNILDNAIRYTPEGGRIDVRVKKEDKRVRIDIEDNGIGIPEEDVDRIFERFYRVDKARSIKLGGTGLGLSIAKHIIDAHGGTISVRSKTGEGTLFSVYLPA